LIRYWLTPPAADADFDAKVTDICTLYREAPALAAGIVYAATDEVHQLFVSGRHGSPLDWLIDTAGVVAGVAIALQVARARG